MEQLTDLDREHIAELIKEGVTEGEIVQENSRGYWHLVFEIFNL